MKNTIRCCISCILPCGALDVIRIVHSNGRVEEISRSIRACEILKAYPKHVLKKHLSSSWSSSSSDDTGEQHLVPKIIIVPPEAELQRGKIYFLMPIPNLPADKSTSRRSSSTSSIKRKKKSSQQSQTSSAKNNNNNNNNSSSITVTNSLVSDQYLTEILSEKLSLHRDRRRGRCGVWRPHLESICESPNNL